mmetsp:Transcript_13431/g.32583  ORF Transcript_13431/g.32583 Transcript_13431/m.32583 type:complete len:249 (+) Transcript_13431:68-814(+)
MGSASDAGDQPSTEPGLSDYEQARARNIEKNNARLRSLGLITVAEERCSNDIAWGRHHLSSKDRDGDHDDDDESSSDEEYSEGSKNTSQKKKRARSSLPPREGSRKSRRLKSLPSEGASEGIICDDETSKETVAERKERTQRERKALVAECREARQRAAIEVANAGAKMAGKENPTATYEHCLMRVRSMTEKGLANRVRAIERAAGKHCVVKMAIFKSCLQDENMWDLAQLASESLERLKGLLPPPLD